MNTTDHEAAMRLLLRLTNVVAEGSVADVVPAIESLTEPEAKEALLVAVGLVGVAQRAVL
jgi:hypothetical protein